MRWFSMVRTVQRYWKMAHDPRTPAVVRYLIYGGIAFTAMPKDWLPEWMQEFALEDGAAVLPGVIAISMMMIPQAVKDDADRETEQGVEEKKQAGGAYQPPLKTAGVA